MKIIKADLWNTQDNIVFVTGNSFIKSNGTLTMGKGAALELAKRYPIMPIVFGEIINNTCGHLGIYGIITSKPFRSSINDPMKLFGVFQTKTDFKQNSRIEYIENSTQFLKDFSEINKFPNISCNFPGIGLGKLDYESVYECIRTLPDNISFYIKDENR